MSAYANSRGEQPTHSRLSCCEWPKVHKTLPDGILGILRRLNSFLLTLRIVQARIIRQGKCQGVSSQCAVEGSFCCVTFRGLVGTVVTLGATGSASVHHIFTRGSIMSSRSIQTAKRGPANQSKSHRRRARRLPPAIQDAVLEERCLLSLTINPTFDSTITSLPNATAIEATINQTITAYEAIIADDVTVNITFKNMTTGLGGSSGGLLYFENYGPESDSTSYLAHLLSHATSANDNLAINSLPNQTDDPVNGQPQISIRAPLARALGYSAPRPQTAPSRSTREFAISIAPRPRLRVTTIFRPWLRMNSMRSSRAAQ